MTSKVRFLANPLRRPRQDPPAPAPALDFHRSLAGYAPTPLHAAPDLARAWGVGEVWLKDETERLGLPAFKVMGASWAAQRAVQEFSAMELVTATAGNHGRAVARVARLLGLRAYVLVPGGTAAARIEAIRAEGATVEVEPAGYDVAVERAAALAAADPARVLVQDTAWPGYEEIPAWIVEGYATIFAELDVEPDVVVLPVGVGSFATAAVRALPGAKVISVEPADAACLLESLDGGRAGRGAGAAPVDHGRAQRRSRLDRRLAGAARGGGRRRRRRRRHRDRRDADAGAARHPRGRVLGRRRRRRRRVAVRAAARRACRRRGRRGAAAADRRASPTPTATRGASAPDATCASRS